MKATIIYDEKVRLSDFAEEHDLELIVRERTPEYCKTLHRFYASFENVEVKEGPILTSHSGNGDTVAEAIRDYADKISNKLLVTGAYKEERKEFRSPSLWFDGFVNGEFME